MKKYFAIWVPIIAVLLAVIIAGTAIANLNSNVLDVYIGKGKKTTVALTDENGNAIVTDANYYELKYDSISSARSASEELNEEIGNEGIVLLKNKDNALPIAEGANVTGMGRGFVDPIYGGTGSGNMSVKRNTSPMTALKSVYNVNEALANEIDAAISNPYYYPRGITATDNEWESTYYIGELPLSFYNKLNYSGYTDAAIIIISRGGGEGEDVSMNLKEDLAEQASYVKNGIYSENGPFVENEETANYEDGQHQLELNKEEKDMIGVAASKCDKVVVVINSSNIMECGWLEENDDVDGVLWVGGTGTRGFASMANILSGKVNPSGKTVDTWSADFTADPSYNNYGRHGRSYYSNIDGSDGYSARFIEYEEGIYIGYKYYETMFYELGEDGDKWYDGWREQDDKSSGGGVVYPFGYGLSYTTFNQEITAFSYSGDSIKMTVKVTNTGNLAGKDVVQIYYNPPYTDYDKQNGIEKATKNLISYAKTSTLQPGKSEEVEIEFSKEDMASYSYAVQNSDGTNGAYMLEKGEYIIYLGKDAHDSYATESFNISETIIYDSDNPRQSEIDAQSEMYADGSLSSYPALTAVDKDAEYVAASNKFDYMTEYMNSGSRNTLTRSSGFTKWVSTKPSGDGLKATDEIISAYKAKNYSDGSYADSSDAMPAKGASNSLSLSDMRGVDYYDSAWDDFLDQLTDSDYASSQLTGMYGFSEIESLGKPSTLDTDGPQGINGAFNSFLDTSSKEGNSWVTAPIIAATWNAELAYEMGKAVGQEAITVGRNESKDCYTNWYGPGLNIHRSPFGGRNYEYYSEDSFITGEMAASVISGATEQGLICSMKHFALNDQESDRSPTMNFNQSLNGGGGVWADEQTIREGYLKAFEIAVKKATMTLNYTDTQTGKMAQKQMRAALGLMTSYNRFGYVWAGGSEELISGILVGEWGFKGCVITDWDSYPAYMYADEAHYAGGDLVLGMANNSSMTSQQADTSTASAIVSLRNSYKDYLYAIANSNALYGMAPGAAIVYSMSPWEIALLIANITVYAFAGFVVVMSVLRFVDSKKHPERYKGAADKNGKE